MDLAQLLAERAISRRLTAFARAMDARDWDALKAIMTPDATADLGTGLLTGPDAVVELMRSFLDRCGATQHLLGNFLIDVDLSSGTATSATYARDVHLGVGPMEGASFSTLGDYHDQWQHTEHGWRLTHRTKKVSGSRGDPAVLQPQPE